MTLVFVLIPGATAFLSAAKAAEAMIFFNGNMGTVEGLTPSQINGVRASGFGTIVIFNLRVDANGNFLYGSSANYPVVCSNGVYMADPAWAGLWNQCKTVPSSVTRIELCIGGWLDSSFGNIRARIQADGTNTTTTLFRNLQALKNALPIDAIDFDTENTYDANPDSQFGQMCVSAGFKVSLCPYTASSYWQALKSNIGTNCDRVYLQCYDGGAGNVNSVATWNTYFGGLKVIAGYWDNERDTTFVSKLQQTKNAGATGGFYWPSCTGCNPPTDGNGMLQYANWIQNVFNSVSLPTTAVETVGNNITFTASAFVGSSFAYQWQVIRAGATNSIAGATNLSLTLTNLQTTNTAIYFLRASNISGVFLSSQSSLTVNNIPGAINNIVTRYAAQTGLGYGFSFTPTWLFDPNNLMLGRIPSATNGNYNLEPQWGTRSVNSLTVGDALTINTGGSPLCPSTNYVTCGSDGTAGSMVVYTLTNTSAGGYNLTNITVYGGWRDAGRDQQAFTVYYSKVSAPASFILLGSVNYNPPNPAAVHCVTRSMLTPASGFLATNVAALKFDFTTPGSENGWVGYTEITASGMSVSPTIVADTTPVTAVEVVGGQVKFIASASGGSPLSYQWQQLSGGVTNNIFGATNLTLTLTNLQLSDAASYRLRVTNQFGVAFSTARALTVNPLPAPVNNVITRFAAQTGTGSGTFTPTWDLAADSLIAGRLPSTATGNFSLEAAGRSVAALTADNDLGIRTITGPGGITSNTNYVTCGNGGGAGATLIYALDGNALGYDLTNVTVYGGWGDAGRDQQAYTVSYSKVSAPSVFITLGNVNYNPANPAGAQSATRAMLTAASGFLATNVAAVKFDFTSPASENGYCGYGAIAVLGAPSLAPVLPTTVGAAFKNSGALVLNIADLVAGRTYELQSTTNLSPAVWITETNFVATATTISLTNSAGFAPQKFYRVMGY